MTKAAWVAHMTELGLVTRALPGPEKAASLEHMAACPTCKERKRTYRANLRRREREDTMRCLGLTKTPHGWE